MFKKILNAKAFALCLLILSVSACATTSPGSMAGAEEIRRGVIEQISDVQIESNHHAGVGAVVGGALGLGVGSLIGRGNGRDVAQVLGTIGGAVAGHEVQKHFDSPVAGQQIIVRMGIGVLVSVTQATTYGLRVGQKVYIEGNGENARVIPQ